jgi:gamma-glutamyltranspeptidase/glutathione hydrolase
MFTTRPEISGTFGVAASTHWLASGVAMAVLERGGNAFDAAAAGGFTLQVVEPHLNGPLGEVPILIWEADNRRARVICGQGPAPQAATIERFRDLGLDVIPGSGAIAACVPGAFDAWMLMLRDRGTWRLGEILAFAIDYAERGYPMVARIVDTIAHVRTLFETHWPSSAAIYLPFGDLPKPGALFRNPDLAQLYRRLAAEAGALGLSREDEIEAARVIWATGFVAEAIDDFCWREALVDGSGRRHHGLLEGADLAAWRATEEAPVEGRYRDWRVLKCGPWSQGPSLLQALAILEGENLGTLDPSGADWVHRVVEASKLALADREAWYADPDHVNVPLDALLSADYATARRALIGDDASLDFRPGRPDGRIPHLPARPDLARAPWAGPVPGGEPTLARLDELPTDSAGRTRGDTCHIDVIDRWGNMVSATPSGGWLQSSPVIPDLGVCLGTRLQMFWLDPSVPAALAPGRRPRTTLTPSLALRDDGTRLAFGTPGGDQQDQWQLQFFLRHVDQGMNLQAAIDAPSFHTDHVPSSFWPRTADPGSLTLEGRFPASTITALRGLGHQVSVGPDWSEGRLSAAAWTRDGLIKAAANPRGAQGYAVGR